MSTPEFAEPIVNSCTLPCSPAAAFAAFRDPDTLATWWGPDGFTTTIHTLDFRPGGQWRYTMHSPGGQDFPNHSVIQAITPDARICLRHVEPMHEFELDMFYEPHPDGCRVTWRMTFAAADLSPQLRQFLQGANDQNLARLAAAVA